MPTIGFYFRGLDQTEVNALRARLNELAARHGYFGQRGPTKGQGNLPAMLVALDAGELALERQEEREMDNEYERDPDIYQGDDRVRQINWLREFAGNISGGDIGEGTAEELVEFVLSEGRISWNISLPQWFDSHDRELLTEMVKSTL